MRRAALGPGYCPSMSGSSAPIPGFAGDAERRAILDRAVTRYVQHGYKVDSSTGRRAVVSKRQRVNVPLNAFLVLLTGGLWLAVIAVRLLDWPTDRVLLTVDESGELRGEFS